MVFGMLSVNGFAHCFCTYKPFMADVLGVFYSQRKDQVSNELMVLARDLNDCPNWYCLVLV